MQRARHDGLVAEDREREGDREAGGLVAQPQRWHGQEFSVELTLPPLAALWLVAVDD